MWGLLGQSGEAGDSQSAGRVMPGVKSQCLSSIEGRFSQVRWKEGVEQDF